LGQAPLNNLPEYAGNPYVAALPPPRGKEEIHGLLSRPPLFHPDERRMPGHLRKHCIMRLARFNEPLTDQLTLAEKLDLVIRQGYVGRSPADGSHRKHVLNSVSRTEAGTLAAEVPHLVENTACGFSLLGCPGMGKSRSIERYLGTIPQVIRHAGRGIGTQIAWLKCDCPYKGSERQLCIAIFTALDALLGTRYARDFAGPRSTTDQMLLDLARIASVHALGALVIDEIQHVNAARGGPRAILNFLVSLVNIVGVPVVLVGTMAGRNVMQDNFREARRATGVGSLIWDRYPKGEMWDFFVAVMWQYQWTREETPLTDELREVLYDESQGIIDVVIKLFMLGQFRAISYDGRRREMLTPRLLRRVAAEEFQLIRPMIQALRSNDRQTLELYNDLEPFQRHVEAKLGLASTREVTADELRRMAARPGPASSEPGRRANGQDDLIRALLEGRGLAGDLAGAVVDEAKRLHPSGDPFLIIDAIKDMLKQAPASKKPKKRTSAAGQTCAPAEGDLRDAVASGLASGVDAHEALLQTGMVATVAAAIADEQAP
jgi:hypothetical protein